MRVRVSESNDLKARIVAAGLNPEAFAFVKRRGHLYVQHPGVDPFIFFREKTTRINADGAWEDVEYFYLSTQHTDPLPDWESVLRRFEGWIEGVVSQ